MIRLLVYSSAMVHHIRNTGVICKSTLICLNRFVWVFWGVLFFLAPSSDAYTRNDLKRFQNSIIDHRQRVNPQFKKIKRPRTDLIIIHTSELGLKATLQVISKGKRFRSGRLTPGGHAHYVIARDGRTFRTLDRGYRADHAGLSMWKGKTNISDVSIGIELVAYHNATITEKQYRAVGKLLHILKKVYRLKDKDVLTHSQVAYGRPNPWFTKNHRGRKRCAKNFDRARANLGPTWSYDPDVRAGRLQSDPTLAVVFYPPKTRTAPVAVKPPVKVDSNIVSKQNSAWAIAGEEYNSPTSAYILPGGQTLSGDRIGEKIGWNRLPSGTKILLNQEVDQVQIQVKNPIKTISRKMTAWSHAGPDYRSDSTFYFLSSGRISPGSAIRDWDDLPVGTRLVVGYKGPFEITKQLTAYKIAGQKYKHNAVIYHLPDGRLVSGDKISDFNTLPEGVNLFLPLSIGDKE